MTQKPTISLHIPLVNPVYFSYTSDPIKERGGRSKRIYRLTPLGREALKEIRSIQDFLWAAAPELKP
jgi:PadR family transcriptional regulator PadR